MNSKVKVGIIGLVVAFVVIAGVLLLMDVSKETALTGDTITQSEAAKILEKTMSKVDITENKAEKGTVTYSENDTAMELPDIEKSYPIGAYPSNKSLVVEIFCSPEKAGTGMDGWMAELAKKFNDSNQSVDGQSVGVAIRNMSSGPMVDYISSGVYRPDALSPSADMWAKMLEADGVNLTVVADKTVGNVGGVVIENKIYESLKSQYGEVTLKTIVQATADGVVVAGYTNPFSSTAGLNFIAATLYSFDSANPLSNTAVDGFNSFQSNVPFVAYNTPQMRNAADNGSFTCFVSEYQQWYNDATLRNNYTFIPYGVAHNNPLYALADISSERLETLKLFADYCASSEGMALAKKYGFDQLDYTSDMPVTDGTTWEQMQKLWKQNKSAGKSIAALFVLDRSGSMSGSPMSSLQTSLLNSMKYINSDNYIGVISYSTDVNVDLPLAKFDIEQQAYFDGAVRNLRASGSTNTYSAVATAIDNLNKFTADNSDVQPLIFLLSDGSATDSSLKSNMKPVVDYYDIPIYTIGYNADLDELRELSNINEAASIDADTDDVVYQLRNLFNANL